ncbi:ribosome hibernation-promoting factor, HPF/YfiA family [Chloroflexota bacterium]
MELNITGKNMEVRADVRHYIERKLGKLDRHLSNILEAKVEITEEKTRSPEQRFVAQVTIDSNGTLLRGEDRGENLFVAIDKVAEVMDRQIEHYKGKLYQRVRGSSTVRSGFTGEETEETSEEQPFGKVVRVKRFEVKPVTIDEAIAQMELLGHDFYLFYNADSEGINLLYRRNEGNYGLIEPVLG